MRIILLILALLMISASAFAQDAPTANAAAPVCSNLPNTIFNVKTDNNPHAAPQAVADKALVYFLQDDADYTSRPRPTTRLGVDGIWAGATHSDSYFYFTVEPGEHHLCAIWQAGGLNPDYGAAAAHFTAVAGHTYYFRAQNISGRDGTEIIELGPVHSDEAQLLIQRYAFNSSSVKK
jgi:Protein of unknown function (DUF2846)